MPTVKVQEAPFDISAEIAAVRPADNSVGAVVTFTGTVREMTKAGAISDMTLEHYPGMTEKSLEEIAAKAEERWPLAGCTVIHRYGTLKPGDDIVLVVTSSAHREAAFNAAQFLMDYLKTNAPFWKRETTAEGANWVASADKDTDAAKRWDT